MRDGAGWFDLHVRTGSGDRGLKGPPSAGAPTDGGTPRCTLVLLLMLFLQAPQAIATTNMLLLLLLLAVPRAAVLRAMMLWTVLREVLRAAVLQVGGDAVGGDAVGGDAVGGRAASGVLLLAVLRAAVLPTAVLPTVVPTVVLTAALPTAVRPGAVSGSGEDDEELEVSAKRNERLVRGDRTSLVPKSGVGARTDARLKGGCCYRCCSSCG